MNSVSIEGYVANISDMKIIGDDQVINFSFAENVKLKDGDETVWYSVTAWNQQAEIVQKILHKGNYIVLFGELKPRYYINKENVKTLIIGITLTKFKKIDKTSSNVEHQQSSNVEIKSNIPDYSNIADDLPF